MQLSAAPHRAWFFLGLVSTLVSVAWWLVFWLLALVLPSWAVCPPIPPAHAHGLLMSHGLFGFFIFGFLTTVFPRWQDQPEIPPTVWKRGPLLAVLGYFCVLAGVLTVGPVLVAGVLLLAIAHLVASLPLLRVFLAAGESRVLHAWVALLGLGAGQVALFVFAWGAFTRDAGLTGGALQASIYLYLLPVYATVTHRMIPFFSKNVVEGYIMRRPGWPLALIVVGALGHVTLGWNGLNAWQWVPDLLAVIGSGFLFLAWQPWRCMRPPLLASLHIGYAWMPLSFLLLMAQSLGLLITGELYLPRAPLHALTIGLFGTLLVAMVTRVTLGHSGRLLHMDRISWAMIWGMQLVALVRIVGEIPLGGTANWWVNIGAAALWLVVMGLWGSTVGPMYLKPRVDGRPG